MGFQTLTDNKSARAPIGRNTQISIYELQREPQQAVIIQAKRHIMHACPSGTKEANPTRPSSSEDAAFCGEPDPLQ